MEPKYGQPFYKSEELFDESGKYIFDIIKSPGLVHGYLIEKHFSSCLQRICNSINTCKCVGFFVAGDLSIIPVVTVENEFCEFMPLFILEYRINLAVESSPWNELCSSPH